VSEKIREYLELRTGEGIAYVRYSSMEDLAEVKGIVFDCDGVLIDERTSYDATIREVTSYLLTAMTGYRVDTEQIEPAVIYQIRAVGSFNNDCETVRLLVSWLTDKLLEYGGEAVEEALERVKDISLEEVASIQQTELREVSTAIVRDWLRELTRKLYVYEGTAASFEEIVYGLGIKPFSSEKVKKVLKYPGPYGESLLTTVFDEAFFGSEVIPKIRGKGPFFSFRGRLKDEQPLVKNDTLKKLRDRGIVLGMSTGRGSWETWRTLGELSEFFNRRACVFVSDAVSEDSSHRELFEKPSPWSLLKALEGMPSEGRVLYVGNSAEDYIMFRKAKPSEERLIFCGVYGGRDEAIDYFIENRVDAVVSNVNQLPKIIEFIEET